jgi:hypothetical protein
VKTQKEEKNRRRTRNKKWSRKRRNGRGEGGLGKKGDREVGRRMDNKVGCGGKEGEKMGKCFFLMLWI